MSIKTLLIGLDGATFDVLDPLMEEGVMPFLKRFFASGARAGLRSIVPPLTPPAWTSLMTGRTPGQHGVFDFFRMESPETRHIRFFSSNDVGCETIWTLAGAQGLRVTSLNYPAMFPAPHLDGFIVPGWMPWRQLRLACWPGDLFDRLKHLPGFNPRELAMDFKLEERATEGCQGGYEEYGPWVELHIRREQNWFEILRHLTVEAPSELTAVVFDGVDKIQHLCWRFLLPGDGRPLAAEWELRVRDLCREYFRRLDGLIERMCELAGEEATVLIASDHGFGPTTDVFHVNAWLAEKGYLRWTEAPAEQARPGALLGVGQVARHTFLLDWKETKAFAATPTSNGIYIVVSRDGVTPGVAVWEYESFRARLMEELRGVKNAAGEAVVTQMWTREQAFAGPHGAAAPDLTLMLRDGGLVSILPSEALVSRREEVAGAHRPVGVFGARGPGVKSNVDAGELSILDVAPAVLYSLGLPVPEEMQGRVPEEIFAAEALSQRPVRKAAAAAAASAAATANDPAANGFSTEDEEALLVHLRDLGYIE